MGVFARRTQDRHRPLSFVQSSGQRRKAEASSAGQRSARLRGESRGGRNIGEAQADLGGLEGADKHCQRLAQAAGAGSRTWRAYLSASAAEGKPAVNARDRIGAGPWVNAKGVQVASSVADLHSDANKLGKETSLSEKGEVINGRGDTPNRHDILTGSQPDGTVFTTGSNLTCQNWTSSGEGAAQVGHHDRQGGGQNPTSWNSAHASKGCSQPILQSTGGDGLFYCFATK
jgi:hypothetical protein